MGSLEYVRPIERSREFCRECCRDIEPGGARSRSEFVLDRGLDGPARYSPGDGGDDAAESGTSVAKSSSSISSPSKSAYAISL